MDAPHIRAAREFPVEGPTLSASADVFPIFAVEDSPIGPRIVACTGTGFRLGRDLFVTCWHCIRDERYSYAVSLGETDPT